MLMRMKRIFAFYLGEFEILSVQLRNDFGSPMLAELREFLIYVDGLVHVFVRLTPAVFAPPEQILFADLSSPLKASHFDFDFHFLIDHACNNHCGSWEDIVEMGFDNRQNLFDIFTVRDSILHTDCMTEFEVR